MKTQKYAVNQHLIQILLSWVRSGEIAIPEIQRPFVWDSSKVRDLMDSLYKGFPVGYVIAWRNPNVRLKDGSLSEGKKILIDGQQRVTALKAAILGDYVVDKNYQQIKIKIAFHPIEERFEVQNPAILKDKSWLSDISEYFSGGVNSFQVITEYLGRNPEAVRFDKFSKFVKSGVVLGQADFAMSKIAANTSYGGQHLRKAIDYFCHLAVA